MSGYVECDAGTLVSKRVPPFAQLTLLPRLRWQPSEKCVHPRGGPVAVAGLEGGQPKEVFLHHLQLGRVFLLQALVEDEALRVLDCHSLVFIVLLAHRFQV